MSMLNRRKMVMYLIHNLPKLIGQEKDKEKSNNLMTEIKYLYSKLHTYDFIINRIRKVGL